MPSLTCACGCGKPTRPALSSDTKTGRKAGDARLYLQGHWGRRPLAERFWGRGYASESAAASVAYGRDVVGLKTIVAITTPANLGSIAVLKKIGLRDAGMIQLPGHEGESAYFTTEPE